MKQGFLKKNCKRVHCTPPLDILPASYQKIRLRLFLFTVAGISDHIATTRPKSLDERFALPLLLFLQDRAKAVHGRLKQGRSTTAGVSGPGCAALPVRIRLPEQKQAVVKSLSPLRRIMRAVPRTKEQPAAWREQAQHTTGRRCYG